MLPYLLYGTVLILADFVRFYLRGETAKTYLDFLFLEENTFYGFFHAETSSLSHWYQSSIPSPVFAQIGITFAFGLRM